MVLVTSHVYSGIFTFNPASFPFVIFAVKSCSFTPKFFIVIFPFASSYSTVLDHSIAPFASVIESYLSRILGSATTISNLFESLELTFAVFIVLFSISNVIPLNNCSVFDVLFISVPSVLL